MPPENILEVLDRALRGGDQLGPIVSSFFQLARSVDDKTKSEMLASLDQRLRAYPLDRVGALAMLAGALVEIGADVSCFPAATFDLLCAQLSLIQGPEDETELPEAYYLVERAASTCLSRSVELRKTLPQKSALLASLRRYQERYGFIGKMVQVLDDEELLVLHLPTKRAFRCTMHGVADSFQLHVLILGAMADVGIAVPAPSSEVFAAASDGTEPSDATAESDWQLKNWYDLCEDGAHRKSKEHDSWIWNEGVPADIATFDGARVVLVEPSKMHRSWNAQRVFPGMVGSLDAPRVLGQSEVDSLIGAMRSSSRP
jgi:hypothetical protein